MNPDYEKRLEAEIDAALKGLPELEAPEGLATRVLSALTQRASQPWYRQSWQMWSAPWRYAAMAVLLSSFGGLCFASWQLTRAAGLTATAQELGQLFSGVGVLWNALITVLSGLVLVVRHLNPVILFGCLAAFGMAWALCIGLGTACARLALARR